MRWQVKCGYLLDINGRVSGLRIVPNTPNSSGCHIMQIGVSRSGAMRDGSVVPIDDVEAAIGTELYINRPKHGIGGSDKIFQSLEVRAATRFNAVGSRIDFSGYWIRDKIPVAPGCGKTVGGFSTVCNATKTGAVEAEVLSGGRMKKLTPGRGFEETGIG